MPECETELRFKISDRVEGLSQRAKDTIKILNLGERETNNRALIEKRKQLSNALILTNGVNPDRRHIFGRFLDNQLSSASSSPKIPSIASI